MRGIFRLFGMILFAPVVLLLASGTYANHVAVPWPDYNFYWMSNRVYHVAADRPQVNVVSNICDYTLQEDSAIANTRAQTAGTSELGDMKSLGYALYRYTCNSNPDSVPTDIFLSYEANYPYGSSGGFTLHQKATADWCGLWSTYYPCGDHYPTIHLNLPKIQGESSDQIVRLLMHELGHATGLDEHCTSDAIMNNGDVDPKTGLPCNNKKWLETGQWYSTDRDGLYAAYHPLYGESTESWSAARAVSSGPVLGFYNLTNPAVDVGPGGRMFIGFRNDKVYNEQWEMAWSDDGVTWQRETHGAFIETLNPGAGMLAHNGGVSIYAVFSYGGYFGYPSNTFWIYRQTWNGGWQGPVLEYSAGTSTFHCCEGSPRVAHSRDHSQYAIAWSRTVSGVPLAEFSFIDGTTGSFTGGVEAIDAFVVQALVFDDTGNPKVIYRVSGAGTSGIGGRRTRVNGVWQPEEQFVIDGMTDPDAFSLVEGEGGYHWSASNSTHGDYHALQGGNLTFTYMKRLNGAYFQSAVDFGALPNPITGTYTLHGLAQRVYGRQAYSVGVVWTNDVAGDLWFIKRRVEGY